MLDHNYIIHWWKILLKTSHTGKLNKSKSDLNSNLQHVSFDKQVCQVASGSPQTQNPSLYNESSHSICLSLYRSEIHIFPYELLFSSAERVTTNDWQVKTGGNDPQYSWLLHLVNIVLFYNI